MFTAMMPKFLRLLSFSLFCLVPALVRAQAESLAAVVPDGAAAFVEVSGLGKVITSVKDSQALEWALDSEEYKAWEKTPDAKKVNAVRATAQLMLGTSLWDAAAELLGGRLAVSLYLDPESPGKPAAVVILRPSETKMISRVNEALRPLLDASSETVDTAALCPGSSTWLTKEKAYVTLHAGWMLASQRRDLLEQSLALLGGAKEKPALAAQKSFAEMNTRLGAAHHLLAWANAPLLRKVMGPRYGLPEKAENGGASLLLGGLMELAVHSEFAAAALDFHEREVQLRVAAGGDPGALPEPAALWFTQHPQNGVIALPKTNGALAGITMHRKFGEWYRLRDRLLAEHLLPAFDKFETDIGNLLPRKDFGEDVLPLIGDNFTLLAALQGYDHLGGQPGIKLPAFALIVDLPKPAEGADTFSLFFQTLAAILNLQAGQEGRQPSVLDSEFYKETKITFSRMLEKPEGDHLPIAYNFQPAGACVGRKYIIATSVQFCRDLVDHFKKPESMTWQNHNSEFVLDGAALSKLAEMNEGFLRSQEIQKGTSPEAAGKRIALLITALKHLNALRYHSETERGMFQMTLGLSWK
jgi:hypothetical protein